MGLREEKKQKTRKAISDTATLLFIERGYHNVTMAEIAAKAEVSVPTLFNYFETKESLVFDEDAEVEQRLIDAVLKRKKGETILAALLQMSLEQIDSLRENERDNFHVSMKLIEGTPELNTYSKQMWLRYEISLAKAIQKSARKKTSAIEAGAIARFVLDANHRAFMTPKPKESLKTLFTLVSKGWDC